MTMKYALSALCLLATPALAQNAMKADTMRVVRLDPALDAVIAPGTRVGRVAGGFGFVEGPVWKNGRLYFSDVAHNNIRALDRMGNVVVVLKASGGLTNPPKGSNSGSNGLVTDKDGTILLTRMGIGTIEGGYVQTDDPQTSGATGSRVVTARLRPPDPAAGEAAVMWSAMRSSVPYWRPCGTRPTSRRKT